MEPEHTPLEKEKHLQSTNFEGSMLIFRRFSNALAKTSRFVFLACPACPKVPCQAFAKGVGTLPGVSPHSQAAATNHATMNAVEKKKWWNSETNLLKWWFGQFQDVGSFKQRCYEVFVHRDSKGLFFSWRLTKSIRWHVSGNKLLLQDHVDKTNAAFCMRCHPTIKRYRFSMGELKHGWVCLVLKVSQSGSNKSLSLLHFKTKVVPNRADHHNTGRCPFQHFLTKRVVDGLLLHVNGNNCLMVSSQL